jgi:ubiquinone/menaquinone biosynthesis C-methylase UbiE
MTATSITSSRGRLREIVTASGLAKGEVALDVGTGIGALIPFIEEREPARIIACDLSPQMLLRLSQKHPGVERHLKDVIDLDLPDASLDVAFMNGVFSNIADKPAALSNLARMLKRGGRIVVSHPEGRAFIKKLMAQIEFHLDPLPDEAEWKAMLAPFPFEPAYFLDAPRQYIAVARRTGD